MIRRLFTRVLTGWVGDDPNPEPSQLDEWDGMVVPALEPDVEPKPLRKPRAVAELDAMTPEQRFAWEVEAYLIRVAKGVES